MGCLYLVSAHDMFLSVFFFFKQKTAYEMRISDWSSDVCSSDLARRVRRHSWRLQGAAPAPGEGGAVHLQRKPELLRSRSQDGYGVGSCRAHDGALTCPIRDSTSMRRLKLTRLTAPLPPLARTDSPSSTPSNGTTRRWSDRKRK